MAFFGSATREQLYYANTWWLPLGIVGAVFLVVVAYVGWWYQRSLRLQFRELVARLDYVEGKIGNKEVPRPRAFGEPDPGSIVVEGLAAREEGARP